MGGGSLAFASRARASDVTLADTALGIKAVFTFVVILRHEGSWLKAAYVRGEHEIPRKLGMTTAL